MGGPAPGSARGAGALGGGGRAAAAWSRGGPADVRASPGPSSPSWSLLLVTLLRIALLGGLWCPLQLLFLQLLLLAFTAGKLVFVVLLFPFHSPVLEPDFYLSLREGQSMGDLDSPLPGQIRVKKEFLFQL